MTRKTQTITTTKIMKSLRSLGVAALALALGSASALAHPGHSTFDADASHIMTSPYHMLVLTTLGVGLFVSARFVQRTWARHTLQWSGAMAVVAAVVLWGIGS